VRFQLHSRLKRVTRSSASEQGAQLVEFAVALPLLVVFVVGIFDFSNAFTLKQRLTNIARDAARAASVDPSNDLKGPAVGTNPVSVTDVFYIVDNYLRSANLNDCGITSAGSNPQPLTWQFTANGTGCGLTITVNRAYHFPATGSPPNPDVTCQSLQSIASGQTAVIGTCVSIQYAYPWRFGPAASLLGRNTVLPAQITAVTVALNEN
jgi:Flp pilus assembly protein TadG